jgi:hypothetical protein
MLRCANCGAPVTATFARVYGDNRDVAHGCPACMRRHELDRGEAARGTGSSGLVEGPYAIDGSHDAA